MKPFLGEDLFKEVLSSFLALIFRYKMKENMLQVITNPPPMYSTPCQGDHSHQATTQIKRPLRSSDHSDQATTCPRGPLQPGPRVVNFSQMTLDKQTTCTQRPRFEGPLSDRARQVSL